MDNTRFITTILRVEINGDNEAADAIRSLSKEDNKTEDEEKEIYNN